MAFTRSADGKRKNMAGRHVGRAARNSRGHRRPSFRRCHYRGVRGGVALEQQKNLTLPRVRSPGVDNAPFRSTLFGLQGLL